LVFAPVLYVKDFPNQMQLGAKEALDVDVIGIEDFVVYDSIIVFSTAGLEHLWFFNTLPDLNPLGNFLKIGQGPFEFVWPPSIGHGMFFKRDGDLYIHIYDFQRGKLFRMNVSRSIKNKRLDISVFRNDLPPYLSDFVMLDDSTFYARERNADHTGKVRFIEKNGERTQPDFMKRLNDNFISKGEDVNILSTGTGFNPANRRIVEMPIGLNFIHVFSLDGSFARTICLGAVADNLSKIERTKREDRMYTFADVRLFDGFFGVVQIDEDQKTNQTERKKLPNILLFDWDGNPLAKWKLDHHITSFDIDMLNGHLYTFDHKSDDFFRYDIKEVLQKL